MLHDEKPIGQGRCEAEILLNQQNRESLPLELSDGAANLLDNHRREALGRLVQHQQTGAGSEGGVRVYPSLRVSPPESLPPPRGSRSRKLGKSAKMCSTLIAPALEIRGGRNRFSLTEREANMARSSGQNATPCRAMRSIDRPMSSFPSNTTEPTRLRTMPMIAFSVVVLPAPFRPRRVTTSPSRTSRSTPCRICDSLYQACRPLTLSTVLSAAAGAMARAASAMLHSEIGLLYLLVLRHFAIVALGQHSPARQHGYAMREIGDHPEIMLDHQDGAVRRHASDEIGRAINVLVAHACHRFIKQHHLGLDSERRRQFEGSLAPIGDFAGLRIGEGSQPNVVQ